MLNSDKYLLENLKVTTENIETPIYIIGNQKLFQANFIVMAKHKC
jgi:hypothetical protein